MIWLNNLIAKILPILPKPIVGLFARQYIAGETLEAAVQKIKALMDQDICVTTDLLGEEVKDKNDSLKAVDSYCEILKVIDKEKLDANISVKPTQMGLKLNKEFCYNNIKTLVELAKKIDNFVRIDMEDSSCLDDTIDIYLHLLKDYSNVGVVVQAYLRQLPGVVNKLIPHKPNLRLCKGAYYWEKREIVYKNAQIINNSYTYVLEKLLSHGCYVGIATHDEKLVWEGLRLIDKLKLNPDQYFFPEQHC